MIEPFIASAIVLRDITELCTELGAAAALGARVFGIDGVDGCGKSTLASKIAERMGWNVISVDDFLERDNGSYVMHLRTSDLRPTAEGESPTIVEGGCILDVSRAANLSLDALVYVKRVGADGRWLDEEECDTSFADLTTLVRSLEEQVLKVHHFLNPDEPYEGLSAFRREVIAYHFEQRPHLRADLVYERVD